MASFKLSSQQTVRARAHQREIIWIKKASSEESHLNRHYVPEGNQLNQESFIGGLPSESALRIRGKPSVLCQSLESLESWLDIEQLHQRTPFRIGITYQRETICALSITGIVTGYWRASSEESYPKNRISIQYLAYQTENPPSIEWPLLVPYFNSPCNTF